MDLTDVELGAGDEDRVDQLVDSSTFTREEAEAAVRFAKVDRDDRDPEIIRAFVRTDHNHNGASGEDGLSADDCASIRREMDSASRPTTVIDARNKHPSVIFRHATGRCGHDTDVDPTTSPRIQSDECREMRIDFQTGDTVEDIRSTYNRSANAVVKHVFGRCSHTFAHKRSGRELSKSLCDRMRRAYRENSTASIADISRAFIIGASTAHRHLTGTCAHRDDVEDPVESNGSAPITEAECGAMRAAFENGHDPTSIADDEDRDPTAVRRHVFGRCRHGGSTFGPSWERVGPTGCEEIRQEYRTRNGESVASIIDRLGVTKGTLYYHLYGDCTHDVDVDPAARY